MRFGFQMLSDDGSGRRRIRFSGNPLALLVLAGALFCLAVFCRSVAKYTWDHYAAYEGTVVEIERDWTDHLASESGDLEHLIIRTPQGRLIDRYISFETRALKHIRPGDYVIKERGFTRRVQRRDQDP
jgi:hypothetical protein